jgi:hypothetical protein
MIDLASQAISDAANRGAAVLLYSPGTDTFLEDLTRNADRVFYFEEGPRAAPKLISKAYPGLRRARGLWRPGHDSMATQARGRAPRAKD